MSSGMRICRVETSTYVAAETIRMAYEEGQRGKPRGEAFGMRIGKKGEPQVDLWLTPEHQEAIMEEIVRRTGSLVPDFVPVSADELEAIRGWSGIPASPTDSAVQDQP